MNNVTCRLHFIKQSNSISAYQSNIVLHAMYIQLFIVTYHDIVCKKCLHIVTLLITTNFPSERPQKKKKKHYVRVDTKYKYFRLQDSQRKKLCCAVNYHNYTFQINECIKRSYGSINIILIRSEKLNQPRKKYEIL